jgi:hypothetical protein
MIFSPLNDPFPFHHRASAPPSAPPQVSEHEHKLACWLEEQRMLYVSGKLSHKKIEALDAMDSDSSWFSIDAMSWYEAERYRILHALRQLSKEEKGRIDAKIPNFGWIPFEEYTAALGQWMTANKKLPGLAERVNGKAIGMFVVEAREANSRGKA